MESKNNAMSLKLLIDSKLKKVVFAEASKSFVDFLLYLLSLPVGTVINLLTTKSMVGSIANLYKSFSNLNETYLQPNLQKNILLNPMPSTSVPNVPLSMGNIDHGSSTSNKKFYTCVTHNNTGSYKTCANYVTDKYNSSACTSCNTLMTREMTFIASPDTTSSTVVSNGFVKGVVSYMISDDLCVTPMSMISSISMMNKFKVSQLDLLQEKEVQVGTEEALELLKVSFQSTTVLTDVFLPKNSLHLTTSTS